MVRVIPRRAPSKSTTFTLYPSRAEGDGATVAELQPVETEALATKRAGEPGSYDVVFSDVVMPAWMASSWPKEVRRKYGELPIAFASGYSHVLAKHGTHGFDLLHKPHSVEQLSRTLRTLVRGSDAR